MPECTRTEIIPMHIAPSQVNICKSKDEST